MVNLSKQVSKEKLTEYEVKCGEMKFLCLIYLPYDDFTDIALIENNAKIAAEIALNLCDSSQSAHVKPASVQSIISKQKPVSLKEI